MLGEKCVDIGRLTTIYIQVIRDLDPVSCACMNISPSPYVLGECGSEELNLNGIYYCDLGAGCNVHYSSEEGKEDKGSR
jgi:hypothetical protein